MNININIGINAWIKLVVQ